MLYRRSIFLASILLLCLTAQAQVKFNKSFGGPGEDQGRSAKQTLDKGYIIAGATSTYTAGGMDIWIVKTDSMGMHQWSKNYGGLNSDWAKSIVQLPDSGYAVAGYTNSFGNGGYDMYLLRIDKSGNEQWTKTYGGSDWEFCHSMQLTSDGGFILGGSTASYGAGNDDVFLVKTDANGDTLWTKHYGGASDDVAHSVWQNSDGGYFFSGFTTSFGAGSKDMYCGRTNAAGVVSWTKTYGGAREEECFAGIQCAMDGGFLLAGYTKSFLFGNDSIDCGYLMKLAANGDSAFAWPVHPGFAGVSTRTLSIVESANYDLMMVGWQEYQGKKDIKVFKTGPYFTFISSTEHGYYQENDLAYSVSKCADGGYIIAGATENFGAGLYDFYLIKTDGIGFTSPYNSIGEIALHNEDLRVIPNPIYNEATILLPKDINANEIELIVTDITGRVVKNLITSSSEGKIIFERENLSPGAYHFIVSNKKDNSVIGTGKLILVSGF